MHCEARVKSLQEDNVDWACAEAMAIGSLLEEGFKVRLCGQDVGRGTFSHRHFIFYDQQTGQPLTPLSINGQLQVIDSPLSELAVLGFEYGRSIVDPTSSLHLWEAQFGDFANGAQVVIDTFVTSGEQKWGLQSGLVLLLPHGYNGAGPEHSSCRLERFLQAADQDVDGACSVNIQVVQPTTPANYFHVLRRQVKRNFRKPLVVASAKQLLRLPAALSNIESLSIGSQFQPIIFNPEKLNSKVCIFTSGELAYELEREFKDSLIVRLEELCPFPKQQIHDLLQKCTAQRYVYCQPEPENMGAYLYVRDRLKLPSGLTYAGRRAAAAPATGYSKQHQLEHGSIMSAVREIVNGK